ncbi:hypothetical protein [Georgenia daeguensis]|uniref:Uncharacterized protein n=1 Tax=Georgenia daeguensis TaxID=908355 RepID=A0ABP8EPQ5_9MICO
MVAVRASGVLGAVALGAGMLIATPASAGTFTGTAAAPGAAATQCIGVAPTYADVLVRAARTETIEHPATWVTEARWTRWVVDQPYRAGVPEISHVEREWSSEPLEGWTETGESRYVVTQPAVPGTPEVQEQTEERLVDPGQPYVPPTYEQVHHDAVYRTVHHEAVWSTLNHPAVYETIHHPAVVEYEFRQNPTGRTYWSTDPEWNAQGNENSQGWTATGASRVLEAERDEQVLVEEAWDEQVLVKEAWDEQVLVKEAWVEDVLVEPGQEFVAPTYEWVVVVPYQPAVPAVPEQGHTVREYVRVVVTQEAEPEVEEVGHLEERWAATSPGEGWEDTGATRQVQVEAAWTEEVHHPAEYENRMIDPGVTCAAPGAGAGGGGAGGRAGTAVPVRLVAAGVDAPAGTNAAASKATVATLPTTGATTGLLAAAVVAGAAGAALLAVRSLAGRIADGVGRHRLDRGRDTAAGRERARRDAARRRAHRRTA